MEIYGLVSEDDLEDADNMEEIVSDATAICGKFGNISRAWLEVSQNLNEKSHKLEPNEPFLRLFASDSKLDDSGEYVGLIEYSSFAELIVATQNLAGLIACMGISTSAKPLFYAYDAFCTKQFNRQFTIPIPKLLNISSEYDQSTDPVESKIHNQFLPCFRFLQFCCASDLEDDDEALELLQNVQLMIAEASSDVCVTNILFVGMEKVLYSLKECEENEHIAISALPTTRSTVDCGGGDVDVIILATNLNSCVTAVFGAADQDQQKQKCLVEQIVGGKFINLQLGACLGIAYCALWSRGQRSCVLAVQNLELVLQMMEDQNPGVIPTEIDKKFSAMEIHNKNSSLYELAKFLVNESCDRTVPSKSKADHSVLSVYVFNSTKKVLHNFGKICVMFSETNSARQCILHLNGAVIGGSTITASKQPMIADLVTETPSIGQYELIYSKKYCSEKKQSKSINAVENSVDILQLKVKDSQESAEEESNDPNYLEIKDLLANFNYTKSHLVPKQPTQSAPRIDSIPVTSY